MPRPQFWMERRKGRCSATARCVRARTALLAAAMSAIALMPRHATAGTIRHDVPDASYTALANQAAFNSVASVISTIPAGDFGGSGVVISDRWVLTAGHMVKVQYPDFTGQIYDPSTIAFNGIASNDSFAYPTFNRSNISAGYDLALLHLSSPTSLAPAARYTGSSEIMQTTTIVGVGFSGNGNTGLTVQYGTKRAGNNVADVSGLSLGYSNRLMAIDFDKPGDITKSSMGANTPLPLEYLSTQGDSGGGWFINDGGVQKLAGITSFGNAGNASSGVFDGTYGNQAFAVRTSQFNAWIDDQISARFWSNAAGGTFSAGSNWEEGTAPGIDNIAVFSINNTYTVNLDSSITNKRIRIRRGNPTLNLNASTYTLGSSSLESSLTVAKAVADNASLTINNGTLSALDVYVGEGTGTYGRLTVATSGTLTTSSTLAIGGTYNTQGGSGTVLINAGGAIHVVGGMRLHAAGRFFNAGTAVWSGGSISATSGATLTNQTGGVFENHNAGIVAGTATNFSNAGTFRKSINAGTTSIQIPVINTGTVDVQAGTLVLSAGGSSTGGTLTTAASTRLDINGTNAFTLGGMNTITGSGVVGLGSLVSNSGTIKIDSPATVIASATINSTGTVDLNHRLVIEYNGTSPITTIKNQIATGFAGGAWTGPGIRSTLAASIAANPTNFRKTAIGYTEAATFNYTTFGPVTGLDNTTLLLRYTLSGDANLDGTVNTADFTRLSTAFNATNKFWSDGDFNYDGKVNALDFNAIATNFGFSVSSDLPLLGAVVPEPQTLTTMAIIVVMGARRRRWHEQRGGQ